MLAKPQFSNWINNEGTGSMSTLNGFGAKKPRKASRGLNNSKNSRHGEEDFWGVNGSRHNVSSKDLDYDGPPGRPPSGGAFARSGSRLIVRQPNGDKSESWDTLTWTITTPAGNLRFSSLWAAFMFVVSTYFLFETPLSWAFSQNVSLAASTDTEKSLLTLSIVGIIILLIDILLSFILPYRDRSARKIITDKKVISINYLNSWFLLDVVAAIPWELLLASLSVETISLMRILHSLRAFQSVYTLRKSANRASTKVILQPIFNIFYGAIVVHWICCIWIGIDPNTATTTNSAGNQYLIAAYWTISSLTTIGYGDVVAKTSSQIAFTIVVMLLGVGIYGWLIGSIVNSFSQLQIAKHSHENRLLALDNAMKYYRVPKSLQQEVWEYYSFQWDRGQALDRDTIMNGLPSSLAAKLALHLNREILEKVPVFRTASPLIIQGLACELESIVYVKGQEIYSDGDVSSCMYFVATGTVELFDAHGKCMRTLGEGASFGETDLLQDQERSHSATAKEYCVLYLLGGEAFRQLMFYHPDFAAEIINVAEVSQFQVAEKLFPGFSKDLTLLLATIIKPRTCAGGEYLFHVGDDPSYIYIIDKGTVLSVNNKQETQEVEYSEGDMLGQTAAISHNKHAYGAVCVSHVLLYAIESSAFHHLYSSSEEFKKFVNDLSFNRRTHHAPVSKKFTHVVRYLMKHNHSSNQIKLRNRRKAKSAFDVMEGSELRRSATTTRNELARKLSEGSQAPIASTTIPANRLDLTRNRAELLKSSVNKPVSNNVHGPKIRKKANSAPASPVRTSLIRKTSHDSSTSGSDLRPAKLEVQPSTNSLISDVTSHYNHATSSRLFDEDIHAHSRLANGSVISPPVKQPLSAKSQNSAYSENSSGRESVILARLSDMHDDGEHEPMAVLLEAPSESSMTIRTEATLPGAVNENRIEGELEDVPPSPLLKSASTITNLPNQPRAPILDLDQGLSHDNDNDKDKDDNDKDDNDKNENDDEPSNEIPPAQPANFLNISDRGRPSIVSNSSAVSNNFAYLETSSARGSVSKHIVDLRRNTMRDSVTSVHSSKSPYSQKLSPASSPTTKKKKGAGNSKRKPSKSSKTRKR